MLELTRQDCTGVSRDFESGLASNLNRCRLQCYCRTLVLLLTLLSGSSSPLNYPDFSLV